MRHPEAHKRAVEAYITMAEKVRYRPYAPGDGMGSVDLTDEELKDTARLSDEAAKYADEFLRQENSHFEIGSPDWSTDKALVYTIEAARALCVPDHDLAIALFGLATDAAKKGKSERAESERA